MAEYSSKKIRAWATVAKMRNGFQDARACQICDTERTLRDRPLIGHHWRGYDHPADVWWVCDSCHKRLRDAGLSHDGDATLDDAKRLIREENVIYYVHPMPHYVDVR
jgi:uncharacterized protein YlaI